MLAANQVSTSPFLARVSYLEPLQILSSLPDPNHLVGAACRNPFAIEIKLDIMHKIVMLQAEGSQQG